MKKLFALVLALILLLSLAACGESKPADEAAAEPTAEAGSALTESFTIKVANYDDPSAYKATIKYPSGVKAKLEEGDEGYCEIVNEALDYELTISICLDGNYAETQEADKANDKYTEAKYAGFDGYSYKSETEYDVNIKLADGEYEGDVIYLSAYVKSASHNLDADLDALFALEEVQKTLNSFEYLGLVKNAE